MNHNVVRSVFTVFVFWWIALAIYGLGWGDVDLASAWTAATTLLLLAILGIGLGAASVWFVVWSEKRALTALLQGESIRGLVCTIGEVPLIAREPPRSRALPDLSAIPDVPSTFYADWLRRHEQTHPAHAALMRAFLSIYEQHKALPATHIPGGHGGRSLLQHSLLAGYFMDKLARSWSYTGLRDRTGRRVVLKLRDQAYKFNPDDPLIALIGVAHDIGKIEAYIFDPGNPSAIVGIHHEHDLTGARMIARLPEAWAISDADRQAMFLAIAHYHHPMELPLSPDCRAIDDRTITLMELLIKTDFVTSRIEAKGVEPTEGEYETSAQSATPEISSLPLWDAFVEIITEHGRINGSDRRFNVATLCAGKGFSKPMLLVKEDALRSALVQRLQLSSATLLGDGRHQITIDLMKVLDEKGVLLRSFEGEEFSPENALWNVDFMVRARTGAEPEKRAGWSAVIVVDPKLFPRVEQMETYGWFAVIQRATMGSARAINKKGATGRNKGAVGKTPAATVEDFARDLDRQADPGKGGLSVAGGPLTVASTAPALPQDGTSGPLSAPVDTPSPTPMSLDAPWEEQAPGEPSSPLAAQAEQGDGEGSAVPPVASEPEPLRAIAPLDVKKGMRKAVAAAAEQGITLRQLNERYLVSNQTLKMLVPEIDWDGCRYKIEQMSRAGKLEAMYVSMGDSGDYALAFKKDLA